MKLKFSYIAYTVVAIALVIGVSRAYALTGPRGSAPAQSDISTPINNSAEVQIKKGALITLSSFGHLAGTDFGIIPEWFPEDTGTQVDVLRKNMLSLMQAHKPGTIVDSETGLILAPWLFATKILTHNIIVGGSSNQTDELPSVAPLAALPVTVADDGFLKVDLVSRGVANNSVEGTQAISIYTGNMCKNYTTITVDAPMLELNSTLPGQPLADMIARQVRLTDSFPHRDSVLSYTDATYTEPMGGTIWTTIQVVNGQLQLVPNTQ